MTFPIQIDATPLFYRHIIIPGVTPSWIDSRVVQSLDLEAKTYNVQFAGGYYADFTFRVSAAGLVEYDEAFDGFLEGRGTNRLVLRGLSVTIDARYLGMDDGDGVLLVMPMTNADWILHRTLRLLPGSHYRMQQGSGLVSSFRVKLRVDGTFEFDPAYELASNGFMAGNGTSTLSLYGYPVLIDGTAAGGIGVHLADIWGLEFARNGVQFANLLPMSPYRIQVMGGIVTDASFVVELDGTVTLHGGTSYGLSQDTFHGVPRVRVTNTTT